MYIKIDKNKSYEDSFFSASVVPRPIGWISTIDKQGNANLAPYSFFNAVSFSPPQVMFSSGANKDGGLKDTVRNIRETKEFVVNISTYDLREEMINTATSYPYGIDEFEMAGLTKQKSEIVKPFCVKESPIHLECILSKIIELPTNKSQPNLVVFGEVVGMNVTDEVIKDGEIDIKKLNVIGRLGYKEYVNVSDVFLLK